jgi:hypothetical protein
VPVDPTNTSHSVTAMLVANTGSANSAVYPSVALGGCFYKMDACRSGSAILQRIASAPARHEPRTVLCRRHRHAVLSPSCTAALNCFARLCLRCSTQPLCIACHSRSGVASSLALFWHALLVLRGRAHARRRAHARVGVLSLVCSVPAGAGMWRWGHGSMTRRGRRPVLSTRQRASNVLIRSINTARTPSR